MSPVY